MSQALHLRHLASSEPPMVLVNNYLIYISLLLFDTSWQPVLRYGESVFTKESQGTEFFVVVALLCKFWSTSKLCIYIYIYIYPRRRLRRMCAF